MNQRRRKKNTVVKKIKSGMKTGLVIFILMNIVVGEGKPISTNSYSGDNKAEEIIMTSSVSRGSWGTREVRKSTNRVR